MDYNVIEHTAIQDRRKDAVEPITLHAIARDACVSTALLTHSTCTRDTNAAVRAATAICAAEISVVAEAACKKRATLS